MGYDETNRVHAHAKNVAVVGAWVGLAVACYLGYQWYQLHNGTIGFVTAYNGGGHSVTCGGGGQPVNADGCAVRGVSYTQAAWIDKVTNDYNTMVIDGWTTFSLGLGGAVTLYLVNHADKARKRKAANTGP